MRECRRQKRLAVERGELPTIDDIISRVISSPAPAYYLSFSYAYRHISACNKRLAESGSIGESADKATRRRMILELAAKSKALTERYPRLTLSDAVARVLAGEQASSFFLTQQYGVRLYYRLMAAVHRRGRRLRNRKLL